MIYNENGIIINDEYNLLQSELHLDSLLQEAITFKDVKRTAAQLGRWIVDKLAAFIDWLEKLKYHKQINTIKKNQDKIKEILEKMYKEDDYAKVIKGTIAEYFEAGWCRAWTNSFSNAIDSVINNPSIQKDKLEETLYCNRYGDKLPKETFFKKENAELSTRNVKEDCRMILHTSLGMDIYIKSMRRIYSKLKAFNFGQNKDEKISYDVMNCLHSFLINGIQSYKNLSTACIELCIKAFNLYNKYNGDMDKVNEEISTYDMSDEKQKEYVNKWEYGKIKNPSDNANLEAIKKHPYTISRIQNPTEEMQIAAVNKDPFSIQCIENPSEKVQLVAVERSPFSIQCIENPSEKVQLTVVEKKPKAIVDIENPSEKVQLVAVEKDPHTIFRIENPTDKVIRLAVDKDDEYLKKHFKNLSEEIRNKIIEIAPEYKQYL